MMMMMDVDEFVIPVAALARTGDCSISNYYYRDSPHC